MWHLRFDRDDIHQSGVCAWRREALPVVALAWLVQGVFHFCYHIGHLDGLDTVDQVGLVGSHAVAVLPYKQRVVLVLRYWADLPEEAIAEIVGVRPTTVRAIAARALARLSKELPQ